MVIVCPSTYLIDRKGQASTAAKQTPRPNPKSLTRHHGGSTFGVHAGFGAFATD
jgi:hypothetical protein